MKASMLLIASLQILLNSLVQGYSERVIFTKLQGKPNIIMVVLDKPFVIDCSTNKKSIQVSLYNRRNHVSEKKIVVADGKKVKREGDRFEVIAKSYSEGGIYYCVAELYGTKYEKEVRAVIVATTQELTPTPDVFPGLSEVGVGADIRIRCTSQGQLTAHTWYKDALKITPDSRIVVKSFFDYRRRLSVSELSVSNASLSDSGTYRCKATTSLQRGYFSFVDSKVRVKEFRSKYSLENAEDEMRIVSSGSSTAFSCSLPNKNTTVRFYRISSSGKMQNVVTGFGKFSIKDQTLLFNVVSSTDMGMYLCKADGLIVKKISLFVKPDAESVCDRFRPRMLQVLCRYNKSHFKKYVQTLLQQLDED